MNITIRSSDIGDFVTDPGLIRQPPGTLTIVTDAGTVMAPASWFYELAATPGAPDALRLAAEAIAEEEAADLMVSLSSSATGIDNTLWYTPTKAHGPRIKVAIEPAHAKRAGGVVASVPFDAKAVGQIAPALEDKVRQFIALNEQALIAYWFDDRVTTDQFVAALKPIK